MPGCLYVVATPIGNLEDLSRRATSTLSQVDFVVAEDTRHSGRLLAHLGLDRPMKTLHEHSSESEIGGLLNLLEDGKDLALISDAGTPLVSDPGFELVRAARQAGLAVVPIPGPCAAVAALSVSGLPPDRFRFVGFPPARGAARRRWIQDLRSVTDTLVLYESPHRLGECLRDLADQLGGERQAFLGRELTKLHEQGRYDALAALAEAVKGGEVPARGEVVLVVAGAAHAEPDDDEARRLLQLLVGRMPPSHAARVAAAHTGVSRQRCYELAEGLKSGEA